MATREGRKTPTGSEIDDWFDLLDEEAPATPKPPAGPSTEISRKVTPSVDPRGTADSWDWDLETPVVATPPPVEAHAEEEFTDFGGPLPVSAPLKPISAASVSSLPRVDSARRFQGTMMFGATPLPTDADPLAPPTAPPLNTPPTNPSLVSALPASSLPAPPLSAGRASSVPVPRASMPSARVSAPPAPPPSVPASALRSSSSPLRSRTPVPRAPMPRAVPPVVPAAGRAVPSRPAPARTAPPRPTSTTSSSRT